MLAFAIVTMFVAGLMVGRTPEYLGKKLEAREVKMTMLSLLSYSLSIFGLYGARTRNTARGGRHRQRRPAWLQRNPLRLRLGHRQQWQFVCRPLHQHAVLQYGSRRGDGDGTVHLRDPAAGGCRLAGTEEARCPVTRLGSEPQPAIHRTAGGRRADHGRTRLFPRSLAGALDRADGDEPRHSLSGSLIVRQRGRRWADPGQIVRLAGPADRRLLWIFMICLCRGA